jgi:hypothetical protein
MLGGGNYEQLNVTSTVASAPPKSFAMMQGPYGFNPVKFWVTFRPLTILLFLMSIVLNWHYSTIRRKLILVSFALDIAVILATYLYFAPETGVLMDVPYNDNLVNEDLLNRAQRWKNLNLVRLGGIYLSSLFLLAALMNSHASPSSVKS